ncbi:unnamed protein product [Lactuca virosa]|uniref:Uncharacterized protein n=1 Tax=Lactuca virosa TaxID=75947 RepID=A0AAU9PPH9_9ASTR|nr:unnamed protein product [Lactuca virosa]
MIIFLTLPDLDALRKGLIIVTTSLLKPFLSDVPFCLFFLAVIYWKYESMPNYESQNCSPSEHLHYQKLINKSQRLSSTGSCTLLRSLFFVLTTSNNELRS